MDDDSIDVPLEHDPSSDEPRISVTPPARWLLRQIGDLEDIKAELRRLNQRLSRIRRLNERSDPLSRSRRNAN